MASAVSMKDKETGMSRVEAVEQMAKAVLGNSDKVISTDEYNESLSESFVNRVFYLSGNMDQVGRFLFVG